MTQTTAHKFGLKKSTWGTLFVMTSISMNVFAGALYTKNYIETHDFQSPVVIRFQTPVLDKKLADPRASQSASMFPKAYAAELPDYRESEYYKKSSPKWKEFVKAAYDLAPIYDYPVSVLLSQAALESAHGTSRFAIERNNFFGWNCNDGREEQDCMYFDNPSEAIVEYMRGIKRSGIYTAAYAVRENPNAMIQAIKDSGYATDSRYVAKVMAMPEWGTK